MPRKLALSISKGAGAIFCVCAALPYLSDVARASSAIEAQQMATSHSQSILDKICPEEQHELFSKVESPDGKHIAYKLYCIHGDSITTAIALQTQDQQRNVSVISRLPQTGLFGSDGFLFYWADDHTLKIGLPANTKTKQEPEHAQGVTIEYTKYSPTWNDYGEKNPPLPLSNVQISFSKTFTSRSAVPKNASAGFECKLTVDGNSVTKPAAISIDIVADVYRWAQGPAPTISMIALTFALRNNPNASIHNLTSARWGNVTPDFAGIVYPRQLSGALVYNRYNRDQAARILSDLQQSYADVAYRIGLTDNAVIFSLQMPPTRYATIRDFQSCISKTNLYGGIETF